MAVFDYKCFDKNGYVLMKNTIPSLSDTQLEVESITTKTKSGKLSSRLSFVQYPKFIYVILFFEQLN